MWTRENATIYKKNMKIEPQRLRSDLNSKRNHITGTIVQILSVLICKMEIMVSTLATLQFGF